MRLAVLPTANDEHLGRTQRARRNAEGRSVKEFLPTVNGERTHSPNRELPSRSSAKALRDHRITFDQNFVLVRGFSLK